MEIKTLHAEAINCNHCVMHIKKAVSQLQGVSAVEGNPETKNVNVTFDPGQVTVDHIKAAMADVGYPAD